MSESAGTRPSKKQQELLSFIQGFIAQHGYGPSYREIMRALNYKSISTVAMHIDNLIAKGHLRKRENSARSLEVCHQPSASTAPRGHSTPIQEKWLIDAIDSQFKAAEAQAAKIADLDGLFVLVGALHVLGFAEAAMAFQARLYGLKQKLKSA